MPTQTPSLTSEDTRFLDPTSPGEKDVTTQKPRTDMYLWGIYIALAIISLIELYSASSREVVNGHIFMPIIRHLGLLGIGCVIMLLLQRVRYQIFYKLTWLFVFLSVGAAIYTLFNGETVNSAVRSFSLFGINVQPSELLKFSAALLIAKVLGDNQVRVNGKPEVTNRAVCIVVGAVLLFSALLIKNGLTNTLLLIAISGSMLLIGGINRKQLLYVGLVFVVLCSVYGVYAFATTKFDAPEQAAIEQTTGTPKGTVDRTITRWQRMVNFLKPDKYNDPISSDNNQEQYSYIAQANGGIFGVGLGNSRETARLPLAFSDYIYAIIVEDGGMIIGLVVLVLYLSLLARAGAIATRLRKAFPTLLIIGMAVFIVYQALFHMAIVTGVFPVSGQPLPFISKGGSSVIISSLALGIMLSISRNAARRKDPDDFAEGETKFADNPYEMGMKKK